MSASRSFLLRRKRLNSTAITSTITAEGKRKPAVETTAPGQPPVFMPTKVEQLREKGPGEISAMEIISASSPGVIQPFRATTALSISGSAE